MAPDTSLPSWGDGGGLAHPSALSAVQVVERALGPSHLPQHYTGISGVFQVMGALHGFQPGYRPVPSSEPPVLGGEKITFCKLIIVRLSDGPDFLTGVLGGCLKTHPQPHPLFYSFFPLQTLHASPYSLLHTPWHVDSTI